jgi:ankyrin repeat protein
VAQDLARTIEATMEVVSRWKELPGSTCSFELSFACQTHDYKSTGSSLETYPIVLERSNETFQWSVDTHELEAILGLWTYSLLKSDPKWMQNPLGRSVGLTKTEASAEATDLYFHKWIFRQREAQMVSSKMISFSEQTFGCYSDSHSDNKEILVVKTDNNLEVMAAQDIYIQFLMSILADLKSSDWDADIVSRSQNSFFAQCTRIDELVNCFESGKLGSREDGLLCVVPVLRHQNLLPELAADSKHVRERMERLTSGSSLNEWDTGFSMVRWLCERCDGQEFERSVYELGLLSQRAMVHKDANVREKGFVVARSLLEKDVRAEFFNSRRQPHWMHSLNQQHWWSSYARQLGWVTWHIVSTKGDRHGMKSFLNGSGVSEKLTPEPNYAVAGRAMSAQEDWHAIKTPPETVRLSAVPISHSNGKEDEDIQNTTAQLTFLGWVIPDFNFAPSEEGFRLDDQRAVETCLRWITRGTQDALCHWISAHWANISQEHSEVGSKMFMYAARTNSSSVIKCLRRRGADINEPGPGGCTALIELVLENHQEAVKLLLANGADANFCVKGSNFPPLSLAAGQGNEEISLLLLDSGADLETRDTEGFTPLHTASREGQLNTTALLLKRGADIESMARNGNTPLLSAAASGFPEVVRLLAQAGANLNAKDIDNSTALMLAVFIGSENVLRLLIDLGADTQQRDDRGRTVFDLAKDIGSRRSIHEILEAAA